MRRIACIGALILACVPGYADTLRELLQKYHLPAAGFPAAELGEEVGGSILMGSPPISVVAFDTPTAGTHAGSIRLLGFTADGKVLRGEVKGDNSDVCGAQLTGLANADDFTVVSTHISPSAGCLIVFDTNLKQRQTLYGFGMQSLGSNRILFTENMIHFAPVHAERLALADLNRGTTQELYPPKGDALRARVARINEEKMPPEKICGEMNDPCDASLFDEEIARIATGGEDRFAVIVNQSASHATGSETPPLVAANQWALYIYQRGANGWLYCEQEISESEARERIPPRLRSWQFADTEGRCKPTIAVEPDMANAAMSPFQRPVR